MRPRDAVLAKQFYVGLAAFEKKNGELPGIESDAAREAFVEQLLESVHRVEYVRRLGSRPISSVRQDPTSNLYDPLKAALLFKAQDKFDEACWQVFLSVHFGKNLKSGWRLARDVYGQLGNGARWGWTAVSTDVDGFRTWLHDHIDILRGGDGVSRGFSNHRKYLSLQAWSSAGTGAAVQSYVEWVTDTGGHLSLFNAALDKAEQDSRVAFAILFEQMNAVRTFGRIGKFDYLTMIGKLGLANIEPNSAHIFGSTGPLIGARQLFDESSGKLLDAKVFELGEQLGANMQVMEDAICNWQKSPTRFVAFRG